MSRDNRLRLSMPDLDDLIYWADIIDGAQFSDAQDSR